MSAIPIEWTTCTLNEVVSHVSGNSSLIKGRLYSEPEASLYPAFSASGQDVWREAYDYEGSAVVVSAVGARCGKSFLTAGKWSAIANTHVVFPVAELLDAKFLWYLLNDENFWVKGGTGQPFVKVKRTFERKVLLPPLNEQYRIVAKLEELFSELNQSVANLTTARAQLKTYRQSLLNHAFEGKLTEQWRARTHKECTLEPASTLVKRIESPPRPNRWNSRSKDVILGHSCLAVGNPGTDLPEGWAWIPLVDIARMESGHTPSRRHPEWWGGDIPWIGIADAKQNNGGVITETLHSTNEDGLANSAARLLPRGTVCISRTASVGYVVEMGQPMATSQDFVNWVPTEAVTSDWLRLVFGADREALRRFGKGTTHTTIYFPEWLSVHVALPPVDEQREIVRLMDAYFREMEQVERTIEYGCGRDSILRQAILKRSFEGRLVQQDPNDEPASELLARIRAERADSGRGRKRGVARTEA